MEAVPLDGFYDVVHARRDVRTGFRPDAPVDDAVLHRVLEAAHAAPSVGFSQPWDVLLVRARSVRERVHALAEAHRSRYAASLPASRASALRRHPDRGDPRDAAERRRHLRPDARRPAHARALRATGDGRALRRLGRAEPLAGRARGGPRSRLGQLLRRRRPGRAPWDARHPGARRGRRVSVRRARHPVPGRAGARRRRMGPAAAAGMGRARRALGAARAARGGTDGPAGQHRPGDRGTVRDRAGLRPATAWTG